jgi:NAD(P)-dependent dehydrogenase (short-subunit alcohol dehydrogenase family)
MTTITNTSFDLTNNVVVITGAAGLLGRQHADAVASSGGHPVLLDIDADAVTALARKIKKTYDVDPMALEVDITNEACVGAACGQVIAKYRRVDALINNAANNPKIEDAAIGRNSRLEHFSLEAWNTDLSVGLTGAFLCSKYFGTAIYKNSDSGTIINMSSDLGIISPDQRLYAQHGLSQEDQPVKPISYSVTKSGILGLTRYLATYWTRDGKVVVRCNAICPGGVENAQPEEFQNGVAQRVPIGRMMKPDELQGTVIFLLSQASTYVNGAFISVDGGRTIW